MERVWRRVQSAGRRAGTARCGCPVQPCQLHVDQRAKRGGGGRKSRGGPQTIVCGCQVQPCPVHPVLIRVRRARPAVGNCDCPLESQPCPHVSRSSAVRRVRRCECPERPCRHTAPSSGTRRRVQMQSSSPTFPPSSQPNQQQQPCDCTERVDCTHTGGGEGTCDCECGEEAKPCSHTVKQRRSRRTCDCSGSSSQPCSHKPQHEGRIKRVKCRVRRAGCAMARCTAELAMLHLHWGLATECAPCRPRALTRRLCRRQQSDNELYRSNSFKFERFERTKDECATPLRKQAEPLSPHLFNLEVERWRSLRTRLTPVFTSGKLKEMFCLILKCAANLEECLEKMVAKEEPVECRELIGKYTTDVIGSCGFGIETNALADNESEFRRIGKKVFDSSFSKLFRLRVSEAMPWLYNLLGYVLPPTEITTFFTKVISDTMNYRTKNNVVRPDFVNTLLELKKHPDKLENIKLTDTFLTAQAYIFFIAGFETSSITMSNALYELALNTDMQDKLRKEIAKVYEKNNGELKYEQVKDMKYLDLIFQETLRKYPAVPSLQRISTCDYTFHGTKVTIPKETFLVISVFAIHRDPNIYPNPDAFIPERFNDDAVAARNSMHYIPFGDGPRNCIASRFAIYQTKVGLITILRKHKVEVCDKTMIPYVMDPATFLLTPKDGVHLKIIKVEN